MTIAIGLPVALPTGLLIATLLALLAGPLLYGLLNRRRSALALMDGFVIVAVLGLVGLEVLPRLLAHGGWTALVWLLAGALLPTLAERAVARAQRQAHLLTLAFAVFGLALHGIADGVTLAAVERRGELALGLAVTLHTLPLGLALWWLLAPGLGRGWATLALSGVAATTLAGFFWSAALDDALSESNWTLLQALVAGSLLHVVLGRPHFDHMPPPHGSTAKRWEAAGALAALALVLPPLLLHPHAGHDQASTQLLRDLAGLAAQLAPALLVALALTWLLQRAASLPRGVTEPGIWIVAGLLLGGGGPALAAAWLALALINTALPASPTTAPAPLDALPQALASLVPGLLGAALLSGSGLAAKLGQMPVAAQLLLLALAGLAGGARGSVTLAPLAISLLDAGAAVSAALALLLSGPAWHAGGGWPRAAGRCLLAVGAAAAIASLLPAPQAPPPVATLSGAALIVLAGLLLLLLLRRGVRAWLGEPAPQLHHHHH